MTGVPGSNAYPPLGAVVEARVRGRVTRAVNGTLFLAGDAPGSEVQIQDIGHIATYEVIAPDQWPPQPGDIWADGNGVEYFIYADTSDPADIPPLLARTPDGMFLDWTGGRSIPDFLLGRPGPLVLRYRKEPAE